MKYKKDSGFWHSQKIYRDGRQKGFGTDTVAHLLWQTLTRRHWYLLILSQLIFPVTVVRSRNSLSPGFLSILLCTQSRRGKKRTLLNLHTNQNIFFYKSPIWLSTNYLV